MFKIKLDIDASLPYFGLFALCLLKERKVMTYSYPKVTYSYPKVTYSDPTYLPLPPVT